MTQQELDGINEAMEKINLNSHAFAALVMLGWKNGDIFLDGENNFRWSKDDTLLENTRFWNTTPTPKS